MQRLGFLLNPSFPRSRVDEITGLTGCRMAGVCAEADPASPDIDTLLDSCDIALIACSPGRKPEIATRAVKRGVAPVIGNTDGFSHAALLQLQQLANEIGIGVVFAALGYRFDGLPTPVQTPFIGQLKRYTRALPSRAALQRLLVNDLASALKLSGLNVGKVRAYGIPSRSDTPSSLMAVVEFGNSSVFTYSLQQTGGVERLSVEVLAGDTPAMPSISDAELTPGGSPCASYASAIADVVSSSGNGNTLELAIESTGLVGTILAKINP